MSNIPVNNNPAVNDNRERLFVPKSRLKKKKRRKDLEHLRRNVLAAKRNIKRQSLQTRGHISNKVSKNALKTTLNMFAEIRRDNENKTQGLVDRKCGRKPGGKTICARLLPEPVIGIFKNGVKGKDVRRKTVKNFPLYGTNKARLHANVFGLRNDEKNYSLSNEISLNDGNNSDNLALNKRSKGESDFHSITHHNFQPFDIIKDNSTFYNANSPKWISNSIGMRSSGKSRQMMSQNVLEKCVQKGGRHKRRELKNSYDSDHDTRILEEIETHSFQNPLKADSNLIQNELPTNRIRDKARSIKRWGISPAFCYDEFSKMIEEKFIFSSLQTDISDPLMSIRATLVARYEEARERRTKIDNDSEDSCSSSILVDAEIPNFCQSATVQKSRNDSWTITRISPQSSKELLNFLQDHSSLNMNYKNKIISINKERTHENKDRFRRKCEEKNIGPRQYIRCQDKKSLNCDWIIEPHSSSEQAFMKRQKKYFDTNEHNIPILRRSDSGPNILFNTNIDEFCGVDEVTSNQQTRRELLNNGVLKNHLTHENTNFSLSPEIMINKRNHKKTYGIDKTNEMNNYEFSMSENETVGAHSNNSENHSNRVDSLKYGVEKIVTPSLHINSDNICVPNYHHDNHSIHIKGQRYLPHCHGSSKPHSKSLFHYNHLLSMNNTSPLSNDHYIEHNDRKIDPVPNMSGFQDLNESFWRSSDFNLDTDTNFIPIHTKTTLQHHAKHYSDTSIQLNNAVLHEFKDLSFEESDLDQASSLKDMPRHTISKKQYHPRSCSNLHQPSKYYAESNEQVNDRMPRRVPVFTDTKNPQSISNMINDELMCRVNVSEQTRNNATASHTLNSKNKSKVMTDHYVKLEKKSREFPTALSRNFPINSYNDIDHTNANIVTITNPNVRFQESFNPKSISHACEVMLDDGRVGLFVPRNYL